MTALKVLRYRENDIVNQWCHECETQDGERLTLDLFTNGTFPELDGAEDQDDFLRGLTGSTIEVEDVMPHVPLYFACGVRVVFTADRGREE